jgi:KUP system potassium uptake protein
MGQMYMPAVNWLLLAAVAATVIGFGNSSRLASAYGVAVMGTMLVTTLLTYFVIGTTGAIHSSVCVLGTASSPSSTAPSSQRRATRSRTAAGSRWCSAAHVRPDVDMAHGREALLTRLRDASPPLAGLLESLYRRSAARVQGTAVFLTSSPGHAQRVLCTASSITRSCMRKTCS